MNHKELYDTTILPSGHVVQLAMVSEVFWKCNGEIICIHNGREVILEDEIYVRETSEHLIESWEGKVTSAKADAHKMEWDFAQAQKLDFTELVKALNDINETIGNLKKI